METVLLTGGCGFIGHHLFEHFGKSTDWKIVILDRLSYAGSLSRITDIELFSRWQQEGRIKFVYHDLRAPINDYTAQEIGNINYIIHLAAESHVDRSIENGQPFVESNVLGTFHLLEFARRQPNLRKFVQISTDEVYGPAPVGTYFKENDCLKPSNPYSATKAGADCLVTAWHVTYSLPVMIIRTMNNFGERQHPEKFIFKTLRAILGKKRTVIHGSKGNVAIRSWLHPRNLAQGISFLIEHGEDGEIYHIVGEEMDVLSLAHLVAEVVGLPLKYRYVDFHKTRPGHDKRYGLCGKKIYSMGWQPPLSMEETLIKTVKWMIDHPKWLLM